MENSRSIIFALSLFAMLTPAWLFAYEPNSTHDALTHEAVDFYNVFAAEYGTPEISPDGRALVQQGAMQEDDDYRMANHFYDPVQNRGLFVFYSSKTWAQSPVYQASWKNNPVGCIPRPHTLYPLYESPCDYSWQRAIYDYAYGDANGKARALIALGHTLHLIEDASVPDHTRNDAHIPIFDETIQQFDERFVQKSPFEGFADQFSLANNNVTTTQQLLGERASPYALTSLDGYFDNAATYSNSNFFSKSTIFDKNYLLPKITGRKEAQLRTGESIKIGTYNEHDLVLMKEFFNTETGLMDFTYTISDPEKIILTSYWNLTSRDAVKNAAGVIRLFFEEVEKEKQTHRLRDDKGAPVQLVQQASVATIKGIAVAGAFGARGVTAMLSGVESGSRFAARGVTNTLFGVQFIAERGRDGVMLALGTYARWGNTIASLRNTSTEKIASTMVETKEVIPLRTETLLTQVEKPLVKTTETIVRTTTDLSALIARLVAAREALGRLATVEVSRSATQSPIEVIAEDTVSRGEVLGATTVTTPSYTPTHSLGGGDGGGSGNSATIIFLSDATVSVPPAIPEATTTADEVANIDVTAPDAPIILDIDSQSGSFGNDASPFHLATTTVVISGTAEAGAAVQLSWIFDEATIISETHASTTGEWSATILLPLGTTTLGVTAIDAAGNVSSSTLQTLVVTIPPALIVLPEPEVKNASRVIINEIGWSGTGVSPDDEWIELYNAGNSAQELSHYYIEIGSGADKISIPLSGTIGVGEYIVVMKDGALHDHGSSLVADALSLPDGGAELTLLETADDGAVVHDTVPFCVNWCDKGGDGISLERWRLDQEGDLASNWGANDENFQHGLDRDDNTVLGTPGARNSLNYRLSLSNTILGMQTFAKGLGAYVIFEMLTIPNGSSLTLGEGTVVKWLSEGKQIVVQGALVTRGTSAQRVVFTSLNDDSVAGDTMNDGVSPIGRIRNTGITLSGASSSALFIDTEIRNAGNALDLQNHAAATLVHTTISNVRDGAILRASTLSAEDSTFRDISSNVLVAFDHSTTTLASTTIARIGSDALNMFDSSLSISTTTFTQIARSSIDAFGSSVTAINTTITDVGGGNHSVGIFHNSGRPSQGVFDGFTVSNLGNSEAFYIQGSNATITNAYATGSLRDMIVVINGGSLAISSSTVGNAEKAAIKVLDGTLRADDVVLTDSERGIYSLRGDVVIHNSVIEGNTLAGITNITPTVGAPVDATGNYWGDADGPTLPTMPLGTEGDNVTTGVLVAPFLTTAPE
jgi:hypothetical protein